MNINQVQISQNHRKTNIRVVKLISHPLNHFPYQIIANLVKVMYNDICLLSNQYPYIPIVVV